VVRTHVTLHHLRQVGAHGAGVHDGDVQRAVRALIPGAAQVVQLRGVEAGPGGAVSSEGSAGGV
jgi:fructose-1,6-bisphosphatase/sedoheptulose 1,7-bisphosphatase-like protein